MLLAKTGKPKRKGKSPFCLLSFSLWHVTVFFSLRCCSSSSSTLLWSHVSHFAVSVTIDSTYWQPHISVNICRIMWFWLISAQQGKSWKRPHYSTLSMSVGWWPGCWANKFGQFGIIIMTSWCVPESELIQPSVNVKRSLISKQIMVKIWPLHHVPVLFLVGPT